MKLAGVAPNELLNAFEGVVYVVDRQGFMLLAGGADWDRFPEGNGAFLPASAVFGRNLFDMVAGEAVRAAYRGIHDRVLAGGGHIAFEYRCDAPEAERTMRMTLGPVVVEGQVEGVLYHSVLVASLARVPLRYLSNDAALRRYRDTTAGLPIVLICAFCADVSHGQGEWFRPEEHYRRGGAADVQLSHGVCPSCSTKVVGPLTEGESVGE